MPLVGKGLRLVGKIALNYFIPKSVGMNNLLVQVYGPSMGESPHLSVPRIGHALDAFVAQIAQLSDRRVHHLR